MCKEKEQGHNYQHLVGVSCLCPGLVSRTIGSCDILVEIPGKRNSETQLSRRCAGQKSPALILKAAFPEHMSRKQNSILCTCMMSFSYEYLLWRCFSPVIQDLWMVFLGHRSSLVDEVLLSFIAWGSYLVKFKSHFIFQRMQPDSYGCYGDILPSATPNTCCASQLVVKHLKLALILRDTA